MMALWLANQELYSRLKFLESQLKISYGDDTAVPFELTPEQEDFAPPLPESPAGENGLGKSTQTQPDQAQVSQVELEKIQISKSEPTNPWVVAFGVSGNSKDNG